MDPHDAFLGSYLSEVLLPLALSSFSPPEVLFPLVLPLLWFARGEPPPAFLAHLGSLANRPMLDLEITNVI